MSESNLYKQFKNSWIPGYIQRYESSGVGSGTPDVHLVNDKQNDIFIELKYEKKPFRTKKLKIRESQIIWFIRYKGRFAYFLYKVDKTFYLFEKEKVFILKDKINWKSFEECSLLITKQIKEIIKYLKNI